MHCDNPPLPQKELRPRSRNKFKKTWNLRNSIRRSVKFALWSKVHMIWARSVTFLLRAETLFGEVLPLSMWFAIIANYHPRDRRRLYGLCTPTTVTGTASSSALGDFAALLFGAHVVAKAGSIEPRKFCISFLCLSTNSLISSSCWSLRNDSKSWFLSVRFLSF